MRMGNSEPHNHEDHIAGKGENSLQHYNMPQAMKIPAAKTAVDKEWENLEKILAWNLTKVKSKKEVIDEARTSGDTVHFASLMDICHLKNAELEAKHQKYKGRVVLRGDIVKDNSGWPGGWGPQGRTRTGGGGLARVPNLRVCEHPFNCWGWHTQGGKDELTFCRGTV